MGVRQAFLAVAVWGFAVGSACEVWAQQTENAARYARMVDELLEEQQLRRGIVSVVGADHELCLALARGSELLVHVRDDEQAVAALKKQALQEGLGIRRITVSAGDVSRLPHADHLADLVISTAADETLPAMEEVLRVLRPRGVARLGKVRGAEGDLPDMNALAARARQAGAIDVRSRKDDYGDWLEFRKPPLKGADDWSHWEHSPDNNPVSQDSVIKAPYMTQFLADPLYIGMPSITTAAGGRTFLAIGHIAHHPREWDSLYKLIARNGYNGTVLWERALPVGYLVHRSAFIATADTFYMINGDHCLQLDPQTGAEQGRIRIPGQADEWKWMAMQDGLLYILTGPKEKGTRPVRGDREFGGWSWADLSPGYYGQYPFGFGTRVVALDLKTKEVVWSHKEDSRIDSRSLAMQEGRLFLFCPERHLRCLDLDNGEVLWTNDDENLRDLIEQPGEGLRSTPGFKTMCLTVATPEAVVIQGQTRMNVVAVSPEQGYILWTKRKFTNNPNAIYVDGDLILGVGDKGSHVVIEPRSGDVKNDLGFLKRACTRLTASGDSLFCRGEGTLRYDRKSQRVLIDGAARPACNDGALPANGMLYIGPWQCDCNLSLIGSLAKCSAGDFSFAQTDPSQRLTIGKGAVDSQPAQADDWASERGSTNRAGSTPVALGQGLKLQWRQSSRMPAVPTQALAVGELIFAADEAGSVVARKVATGELVWEFPTNGPVKATPTFWEGRVYVGSGDGFVYCLSAQDGELLWKFQAAPVERQIMVYGRLCSTWPVNSGVTVHDEVAYFAAGIIDHDGTYVYGLNARTGELVWHNSESGHLSDELRKGVSVQGGMSVLGGQLLLAGGNQISPAPFDLSTGKLNAQPLRQGQPKANNGHFVGVFQDQAAIVGGRVLYSAPENVATKGSYVAYSGRHAFTLNFGGVPPAWDDDVMTLVNFKHGALSCFATDKIVEYIKTANNDRENQQQGRRRMNLVQQLSSTDAKLWETKLGEENKFEAISTVLCQDTVLAVVKYQQKTRSQPQWFLVGLQKKTGNRRFQIELQGEPLPGGLSVARNGSVLVSYLDGGVSCYSAAN